MATKTIRISEEVYERLEARKREGESFTDVIERLLDDNPDFYAGFGAWEGTDKPEAMREAHESLNRDLDAENY
jgi:predicted CopG family antitoxin